jgi:predicted nuclease of predicted toxin-antitoxin system
VAGDVKFFVDECISPSLARHLHGLGYDAVHPRDRARLGETDRSIFARAIDDDRIVVTENAGDFRDLAAVVDMHPGIIVLPSVKRDEALRLMDVAVAYLLRRDDVRPADLMVNAVLTIDRIGQITVQMLP